MNGSIPFERITEHAIKLQKQSHLPTKKLLQRDDKQNYNLTKDAALLVSTFLSANQISPDNNCFKVLRLANKLHKKIIKISVESQNVNNSLKDNMEFQFVGFMILV